MDTEKQKKTEEDTVDTVLCLPVLYLLPGDTVRGRGYSAGGYRRRYHGYRRTEGNTVDTEEQKKNNTVDAEDQKTEVDIVEIEEQKKTEVDTVEIEEQKKTEVNTVEIEEQKKTEGDTVDTEEQKKIEGIRVETESREIETEK